MNACPETPDLLDHLEGRLSLEQHLGACEGCRRGARDLAAALAAEQRAFAPPGELETERALDSVLGRGRVRARGGWGPSLIAFGTAAVALAMVLPAALSGSDPRPGPLGGGQGPAAPIVPARDVVAPRMPIHAVPGSGAIVTDFASRENAVLSSESTAAGTSAAVVRSDATSAPFSGAGERGGR